MDIKNIIRLTLNLLHIDLTKNLEYDRLTKSIMNKVLKADSNCIDVGCHKGEILDIILKRSPKGTHFGFEPIPYLYNNLKKKYNGKANILPYALAEKNGTSTFQFVKNAPAYSGIKKRKYNVNQPDIEEINVELKVLDELIPPETKIDFIKIDVEGAEFGVLKGAANLIKRDKPLVIFEFGLGASDYYGTKPEDLFGFFENAGMKISTLKGYIKEREALSLVQFDDLYNNNKEYYFIACG
jgi:FkbM family methyltransferase